MIKLKSKKLMKPLLIATTNSKKQTVSIPARTSQRGQDLRLQIFSDNNFSGERIVFNSGEVAVRDLRILNFNDVLSSFRLRNRNNSKNVTLVLFEDIDYQGRFIAFRGSQNVSKLTNRNFNDLASSFVLVARNLSNSRIRQIQREARPPGGILEIRR